MWILPPELTRDVRHSSLLDYASTRSPRVVYHRAIAPGRQTLAIRVPGVKPQRRPRTVKPSPRNRKRARLPHFLHKPRRTQSRRPEQPAGYADFFDVSRQARPALDDCWLTFVRHPEGQRVSLRFLGCHFRHHVLPDRCLVPQHDGWRMDSHCHLPVILSACRRRMIDNGFTKVTGCRKCSR
jgi:hypothetical protein